MRRPKFGPRKRNRHLGSQLDAQRFFVPGGACSSGRTGGSAVFGRSSALAGAEPLPLAVAGRCVREPKLGRAVPGRPLGGRGSPPPVGKRKLRGESGTRTIFCDLAAALRVKHRLNAVRQVRDPRFAVQHELVVNVLLDVLLDVEH